MTMQIDLPKDVGDRLRAEVSAGRYATVTVSIFERVSRKGDLAILAVIGGNAGLLSRDLDAAWLDRDRTVAGYLFENPSG